MDDQAEITEKRDAARRARRLACYFPDQADGARALAYASELEAQADALEQRWTQRRNSAQGSAPSAGHEGVCTTSGAG